MLSLMTSEDRLPKRAAFVGIMCTIASVWTGTSLVAGVINELLVTKREPTARLGLAVWKANATRLLDAYSRVLVTGSRAIGSAD